MITCGQKDTDQAEKYIHPIRFDKKRQGPYRDEEPGTLKPKVVPRIVTPINSVALVRNSVPKRKLLTLCGGGDISINVWSDTRMVFVFVVVSESAEQRSTHATYIDVPLAPPAVHAGSS